MNENQADKIIELLESIRDTQQKLLDEQRKQDDEMRQVMNNLPFNQEEDEDKKSTEAFYNQKLVQAAQNKINNAPWVS